MDRKDDRRLDVCANFGFNEIEFHLLRITII